MYRYVVIWNNIKYIIRSFIIEIYIYMYIQDKDQIILHL